MDLILCVVLTTVLIMDTLGSQIQYSAETTKEICVHEELNIRCDYKDVLVITSAFYGHLYQGRCTPRDFGHFGCQANVLPFLDEKCSSKRNCELSMSDSGLVSLAPSCALGLITFLEAKYICVKGQPATDFCRVLPVQQSATYFLSLQAGRADCILRNDQAFISLAAEEGQKIKLTITDFKRNLNTSQELNTHEVEQNGETVNIEFTQTTKGDMEAEFVSSSSMITLILKDLAHNALISYQATGCLDLVSPPNTWTQRNDDVLTVGCYNSDQTWNLSCRGTKWIGAIGNCTAKQKAELPKEVPRIIYEDSSPKEIVADSILSKEIWIVIISMATVFACGVVFLVGCICVKLAKRKYAGDKNYERCEMVPLDANLRPIRNGDIKDENIRAWQQTMTSQGNNRSLARNNNGQIIMMDQDLITINGI